MPVALAAGAALEATLKRDRLVVVIGLVAVIAVSWAYVLAGAGMDLGAVAETGGMMAMTTAWSPGYFLLMLAMWWVMMVAMMLPSAAPMVLLYATVNRRAGERGHAGVPTGMFAAGYLLVWGAFSLLATGLQWGLEQAALVSPEMARASVPFGAALLVGAGVYQMTPLKYACLRRCQAPIQFLGHGWRRGRMGAVRMGLEHGAFCLGCCWVLMGLLFYGGVMSLLWIGGLALYVLIEKLVPAGPWIGRSTGLALIVWGTVIAMRYVDLA